MPKIEMTIKRDWI